MTLDDDDLRFGDREEGNSDGGAGGQVDNLIELLTGGIMVLVMLYVLWSVFETLYLTAIPIV